MNRNTSLFLVLASLSGCQLIAGIGDRSVGAAAGAGVGGNGNAAGELPDDAGAGGTSPRGGSAGKGGTSGTGGSGALAGSSGSATEGGAAGSAAAPNDGGAAGETGGSSGDDAGGAPSEAGQSGTGGSSGSGAGTAGGGSGGTGPCSEDFPGVLQYGFDTDALSASNGDWLAWATYNAPSGTNAVQSTPSFDGEEGHSCPGSLKFSVTFEDYGVEGQDDSRAAMVLVNSIGEDWTGKTTLHAWLKVPLPAGATSFAYLNGFQLSTSSGYFDNYDSFLGAYVPSSFVPPDEWYELTLPLPTSSVAPPPTNGAYEPSHVQQLGIQVVLEAAPPEGGPEVPYPTVFYVDDIWLE